MRRPTLIAALLLATSSFAQAQPTPDPTAGKLAYSKCAACHAVKPNENRIGPSLHGIIGRPAHSAPGFLYSPAMKAYDVTWDAPTLDHFLINPRATVPNTRMVFPGLNDPQDRANLIAYLATLK